MSTVTMKQLLEAGVHFGHQTRRWNPKMSPFLFGERNGIHIVDLRQTLTQLQEAYRVIEELTAKGGVVMFVGTKKQAQHIMADAAESAGMPYITNRWLGGMLTNFKTSHKRILYMKELERMDDSGEMEALPKKERIRLRREKSKLVNNLGGVRDLTRPPDALFIVDILTEHIAVKEATRLGIPIVALVDTNCDPDPIDIVIPGNDDAIRSAQLFADSLAQACLAGRARFESGEQAAAEGDDTPAESAAPEPAPAASPAPAPEAPTAPEAPAAEAPATPEEPSAPEAPATAEAQAAPEAAAEPEAATAPEAAETAPEETTSG
ncbi:MAG: 30S ribosomal protein S2 [Acidimicrobiia bacterium]